MPYLFYMDKMLLPITPSKVQMEVSGNNKTINLINESQVNQIKGSDLTSVKFDFLLPQITQYPFATYSNNKFKPAKYFLEQLEALKKKKKPFKFKISRSTPDFKGLFDTSLMVTLEKYTITEDSKNGFDVSVSVTLKEYREYGTKTLKKRKDGTNIDTKAIANVRIKDTKDTYTIKKNDTLWTIAKKELNNGSKWKEIYTLNKSVIEKAAKKGGRKSSSNGWWIYPGTVIRLPKSK